MPETTSTEFIKIEDRVPEVLLSLIVIIPDENDLSGVESIRKNLDTQGVLQYIKILPYACKEDSISVNDAMFNVLTGKYVMVVHCRDTVDIKIDFINKLQEVDTPLYFSFMKRTSDASFYEFGNESDTYRFIYNKALPILRLKDLIQNDPYFTHTGETLYSAILYRDFLKNFSEYEKVFSVDYITSVRDSSFYSKELEALSYEYEDGNGNSQSIFNTVDILLPMARQYLDIKDYYNLGYSETSHLVSIIKGCKLGDDSLTESIKELYSGNEILNAYYIYKNVTEAKDKDCYKNTVFGDVKITPTDLSVDIVLPVSKKDLRASIEENVLIPHSVHLVNAGDEVNPDSLKYKYVWFISEDVDRVLLTDYTIQPNESDFVFFGKRSETIYDIGEDTSEQPVSKLCDMWIKTETYKKEKVNIKKDILTEGRIKTLMKRIHS